MTQRQTAISALHWLLLIGFILAALALRLQHIQMPLRTDEAWTFNEYASRPLHETISTYNALNNHIFHSVLVHIFYRVFGNHELWIRLPTLFAGLLLIAAVYRFGRDFFSANAGLLAAGLAAVFPFLAALSVDSRGYSLQALIFVGLFVLARRIVHAPDRARWAAFAGLIALGLYALPTTVYGLAIVGVWLLATILVEHRGPRRLRMLRDMAITLVLAGLLTLVLYLPALNYYLTVVVPGLAPRTDFGNLSTTSVSSLLQDALEIPIRFNRFFFRQMPDAPHDMILVGLLLAAVFSFSRRFQRSGVPLLLAALAAIIPVLLVYPVRPLPRVWLFLVPLILTLSAAGFAHAFRLLRARIPGIPAALAPIAIVAVVAWIGVSVAQIPRDDFDSIIGGQRTYDMRELTAFLNASISPGDYVLCQNMCDVFGYYISRYGLVAGSYANDWDRVSGQPETVFVVLSISPENRAWYQERGFLDEMGLESEAYEGPALVAEYDLTAVYRYDRVGA